MNSKPCLIIFIDGLRFDHASTRIEFLRGARISPVVPAAGFSNNLYPEMFCGKNPDALGFFNEWSPVESIRPLPGLHPLRLFDVFRRFTYLNAGFRIVILRKLFGRKTANIPFRYWGFFEPSGPHNVRSLGASSVLTRYDFEIVDSAELSLKRSQRNHRDIQVIERLRAMTLAGRNMFVSLTETDSIAHADGLDSAAYDEHLRYLDRELARVVARYRAENPGSGVYLLSDHGMASVTRHVHVDLEREFGRMDPGRYVYFLDSTFLRVWVSDPGLGARIRRYLASLEAGTLLSDAERLEYGISNPDFGDIIFRADEGVLFTPSFFGFRGVRSMHGYDSRLPSQTAFFAEVHAAGPERPLPTKSREVFDFLCAALADEPASV